MSLSRRVQCAETQIMTSKTVKTIRLRSSVYMNERYAMSQNLEEKPLSRRNKDGEKQPTTLESQELIYANLEKQLKRTNGLTRRELIEHATRSATYRRHSRKHSPV